jgi:hypothetical protein
MLPAAGDDTHAFQMRRIVANMGRAEFPKRIDGLMPQILKAYQHFPLSYLVFKSCPELAII